MRKPTEAWLRQLDSWLPWQRRAAALALARCGDPRAVAPLTRRLQDWNRSVRCAAMQALWMLGALDAVAPMVCLLVDHNPLVRQMAALVLAGTRNVGEAVALLDQVTESGVEGVPPTPGLWQPAAPATPLLELLRQAPPAERQVALLRFEAAFAPIADRISSSGAVPGSALAVVIEVGGTRAIPPLVAFLGRSEPQRSSEAVRLAMTALRRLAPGRETAVARAALDRLIGVDSQVSLANLGRLLGLDPNYHIRLPEVRRLLIERGEAGALGLLHAVDVQEMRERRAVASTLLALEPSTLAAAAFEVLKRGDMAATTALRAICDEEPAIWRRVVGQWRWQPVRLLDLPERSLPPWARLWRAEALGESTNLEALPALRALLDASEESDQLVGAVALSLYGEPRAVGPLARALGAPARETRLAAALALGRLGAPAASTLPRLRALERMEPVQEARRIYRTSIALIEQALKHVPAELEAASAPAGRGNELEAAAPPAGTGPEAK